MSKRGRHAFGPCLQWGRSALPAATRAACPLHCACSVDARPSQQASGCCTHAERTSTHRRLHASSPPASPPPPTPSAAPTPTNTHPAAEVGGGAAEGHAQTGQGHREVEAVGEELLVEQDEPCERRSRCKKRVGRANRRRLLETGFGAWDKGAPGAGPLSPPRRGAPCRRALQADSKLASTAGEGSQRGSP